jgi:AcrR family transcriptional regulator
MPSLEKQFIHEALVYWSDEEFLARAVPFLQEGISAGQPAIAAVMPDRFALICEALGDDAQHVSFVDAGTHYRRPAHALAEYRRQLDEELSRPTVELVRVIGEVQFGATTEEHEDWTRYESVLNQALAGYPAWVMCPYDARFLPDQVVADALHTHPLVSSGGKPDPSAGYMETDELVEPPHRRETERADGASGPLTRLTVTREADLDDLRRVVAGAARAGGLASVIVDDVTVAVGELARDGLRRGEGETSVQVVRDRARWHCEVTGPASEQTHSDDDVGLSIARLIGERVEVDAGVGAQTVRITFSGAADARRRILDAASELFYQNGIRATGINTIIAHSGVAKATFFRHFPAKNDLVFAWLQQPASRWFDRIRSELDARTDAPASRLLAFFDLLGEWFGQDEFRGCAFQNAAAETPAAEHPVRQATQDYALEIRHYLERLAADAGLADPAGVAEELHLLAQGAIATAVVTRSPRPAMLARAAAERLLA